MGERLKVIGLMSGTSADGIDAALVEIEEKGRDPVVRLLAFHSYPYPAEVRKEIEAACLPSKSRVDRLSQLNFLLGELFAAAAINIARSAGVDLSDVFLIGSHGQTVQHVPTSKRFAGYHVASTLQLGEPSVIAQRTGVTTVADFRPRDMAAGGCGAPLTPYFHYLAFRDEEKSRVVINVGGIANLTYIPAGASLDDLVAFDTGPGNCLIDQLMRELTSGEKSYDEGGRLALAGQVKEKLLDRLLSDPFVKRSPPKSTGPEVFNLRKLRLLPRYHQDMKSEELLATITAFSAHAIAYNIRQFVLPRGRVDQVAVGGGGVKNRALYTTLKVLLAPLPTCTFEDLGQSSHAAEAESFALLAFLTIRGREGNIPGATGAREKVPLGKIVPGVRPRLTIAFDAEGGSGHPTRH